MKVLCIGHCAYDITVVTDMYPCEGDKYRVSSKVECGGGPASNAAYLLGKWGIDTYMAGVVGNDIYGKKIRDEFSDVNVNTNYLELSNKYNTTSNFIVVNRKSGTRTIFTYRNPKMKISDINISIKPDFILCDAEELDLSLKVIKKYPKAVSVMDASRARYASIKLGKVVDYLIVSQSFAEEFTGCKIVSSDMNTISKVYNLLEDSFKNNIVITLGSDGCVFKNDDMISLMPSYKVSACDTACAGDFFHGAFMYGLINKYKYADIMRLCNITGALSTKVLGGRTSTPKKEEVLRIYEKSR